MTEQYYCYDELIPGDSPALNEKIKNRLFRYIFTRPDHKDWALNLFNSLEGTHYTNPDDLNLCILQNSIYMDIQNKFSVFVCGILRKVSEMSPSEEAFERMPPFKEP